MAFARYDRLKDYSNTTGTGTLTLLQTPPLGYFNFLAANGNQVEYCLLDASGNVEVGLGTVGSSGTTLTRDTVYFSTNSNSKVSFTTKITVISGPVAEKLQADLDAKASKASVNTFTAAQGQYNGSLTDGSSISWDAGSKQSTDVTLGGNRTLSNPTNLNQGFTYVLKVIQDGTGSRTLAYGNKYKWPGGTAPTLSTGAGAVDILTFVSDGTNMYGSSLLNFS